MSNKFRKKINTATDCENLAHILKQKFNDNVSSQTLRRFFGIIKSTSKTSVFTLDILSRFCGYNDYENFRQTCNIGELESFFGSDEDSGKDFWQKSEDLCRQIAESPELLINTHHRMMPFPLVRKYFMENHPMRDMLGTVYSQYFLSYLKFNHGTEAKIFAYGFLFHAAFLLENEELLELVHRKVSETDLTPKVYVIPAGLKYGVMLLYADFTNNEALFNETFETMKIHREEYIPASGESVCSFEYTVLESLIFTDRTAEMLYLIENNTPYISNPENSLVPAERKRTHVEVWKILCVVAYRKAGDKEKALQYLQAVNLNNLGFGWRKYYSIIFHVEQIEFSEVKDQHKISLVLRQLIDETHFSYYETKISAIEARVRKTILRKSRKESLSL